MMIMIKAEADVSADATAVSTNDDNADKYNFVDANNDVNTTADDDNGDNTKKYDGADDELLLLQLRM